MKLIGADFHIEIVIVVAQCQHINYSTILLDESPERMQMVKVLNEYCLNSTFALVASASTCE